MYLESKSRQQKVTKPLHPPAFHLYSHLYHFHNIWMFNHPLTTKYHLFFSLRLLGDEILNGIVRKKFFHFPVKLCRQCLIMCNDQRRFVQLLNDVRHGKCLSRAGDTKQGFKLISFLETFHQFRDCLRLIAGWFVL